MTARSLVAYSVGMTAIVMVKILAPGFYARQNTRTPVRVAMASMALNIVFCALLFFPMKHVGLALATSLSSIFNAAMLFFLLRREQVLIIQPGWLKFSAQALLATIAMVAVLLWLKDAPAYWLEVSIWERALKLAALIFGGGITYLAALLVVGIRPAMLWLPDAPTSDKAKA